MVAYWIVVRLTISRCTAYMIYPKGYNCFQLNSFSIDKLFEHNWIISNSMILVPAQVSLNGVMQHLLCVGICKIMVSLQYFRQNQTERKRLLTFVGSWISPQSQCSSGCRHLGFKEKCTFAKPHPWRNSISFGQEDRQVEDGDKPIGLSMITWRHDRWLWKIPRSSLIMIIFF